jgi:uncharacterized protein with von Willebrand factor type A (vWA) domain
VLRLVYSRWDGTQELYSLEADAALDELSRYLMEGLDVGQSLDWMRMEGFELAGTEFRVMGLEELLQKLRREAQELLSRYNMDETFDEHRERLDEILDREQSAVGERHGVESQRWNEFNGRRHQEDRAPPRLSERVERFRDYDWVDADAEADYRELLDLLDELRKLEEFRALNQSRMQGPEGLSFDDALDLMSQLEAMTRMMRDLMEGNFESLPMDQLAELLGDDAVQSIILLRDLEGALERAGYVREGEGGLELTPRAIRRLGELALEMIYAELQRGGTGSHESRHKGISSVAPERTRRHVFGEPAHLDAVGTLRNAVRRRAHGGMCAGVPIELEPDDLEVFDTDQFTETTTVLLLDMSWSMSWSERWPAAKRVAIALDHLIRTRFPRDHFFVVGFYTRARQLHMKELPELSWNMTDPFTNLQEGLQVAQRLIDKHPSSNTQIIVITDGQPTAYFVDGELRVEWPNGYGGTSPRANRETLREVRRVTRKGITINTFMLDDAPELVRFVEAMTRINKGRAFYTTPGSIGQYVMVDYLGKKKRRIR